MFCELILKIQKLYKRVILICLIGLKLGPLVIRHMLLMVSDSVYNILVT